MTDDHLVQIETKIAFQEKLLKELDDVVCQQQRRIDKLEATCHLLANRCDSLAGSLPSPDPIDEKPPHY